MGSLPDDKSVSKIQSLMKSFDLRVTSERSRFKARGDFGICSCIKFRSRSSRKCAWTCDFATAFRWNLFALRISWCERALGVIQLPVSGYCNKNRCFLAKRPWALVFGQTTLSPRLTVTYADILPLYGKFSAVAPSSLSCCSCAQMLVE